MSELLTIEHSYDTGTTVDGTEKGSPAHHVLAADPSWRWWRKRGQWGMTGSPYRRPHHAAIELMTRKLREAGYTVETVVDETMPTPAEQEADRAQRADRRADSKQARADTLSAQADATRRKGEAVFDAIPFGQPILIGHHSETADRNRRERASNQMWKAHDQRTHANQLAEQAAATTANAAARNAPETVANRIRDLEATERKLTAELDGTKPHFWTDPDGTETYEARPATGDRREKLADDLDEARQWLDHWRGVRRQQVEAGRIPELSPADIAVGDWVHYRRNWHRVRRVNKKSVSVPNLVTPAPGPDEDRKERTDTIDLTRLTGHRTTEDMPSEYVAAYETPGVQRVYLPDNLDRWGHHPDVSENKEG